MRLTPVQSSFSAGEITPLMLQRSDTEGYNQGARELRNAIPDSRGPAIGRHGNKYISELAGAESKIFTFPIDENSFFTVIFTDALITILEIDGTVNNSFATSYDDSKIPHLQFVRDPAGLDVYVLHEEIAPQKLTYNFSTNTMTWAAVVFTSKPAVWTGTSYPSCGDFFEGRLWLGGPKNNAQSFWGSKSGSPENFTLGTLADDAIAFTLAKYGRIEWMAGFKNLVIGTALGEHVVSSGGGLITPSDISVEQQSSYGSANIQPAQVGDQIFYVSADRRKLRAIQYEWQSDNWLSKDLTFNSEHITESGIKQITWQQNPSNLLICVLNDGDIAVLTYERGNNVYGWAKIETNGNYLSASAGSVSGIDVGVAAVSRNVSVVNFETNPIVEGDTFMDSWVSKVPSGTTVSGLSHLEGKECQILLDDAVHPNRTVSGGAITLQTTGSIALVGLAYTPRVVTLPADDGSHLGSASAWKKRYNKIYVRVLNSAIPLVNGKRAPDRHPSTPMDSVEPLLTEDVVVSNLGHSNYEQITVEQDLPLPLVVLGIFGELGQDIT